MFPALQHDNADPQIRAVGSTRQQTAAPEAERPTIEPTYSTERLEHRISRSRAENESAAGGLRTER